MCPANELIEDPLFQLNVLLWLAQPLPAQSGIAPLLYENGFTVYAISPQLGVPLDVRLGCKEKGIDMQGTVAPDVVLERKNDHRFAFVECKKSSFGASSSTARQARSLLVVAGPPAADVLSEEILDSSLVFLIPEDDRECLTNSLTAIREELVENGLPAADLVVLGLLSSESEVCIVADDRASNLFQLASGENPFIELEPDTDPRPLYLIPYDPDIQQSPQQTAHSKRILFERMQSSVIAAVGPANPHSELTIRLEKILGDATLGMFSLWENAASQKHLRRLCGDLMRDIANAVNVVASGTMVVEPTGVKIALGDEAQSEKVLDALTRFSCETLELESEPEATLFDGLEDNGPASGETN